MWCYFFVRTIGIIGNGGHSKRIQKILKRKKLNFFIYKPDRPKYFENKSFKKLKKCKVIFIISPNNSHYNYIKKLHNKNNYIFCEKPPVAKLDELKKIRKIYNGKIYFNFNFRFSKFSEILKNIKKYKLGKLLYANLISSNGLALKKEYKKSWRSNFKQCPKGIFEIVAIHYVDLINFFFKIKKLKGPYLLNNSAVGTSFDTAHTELKLNNNVIVNIFTTYNSAYTKKLFFLFSNGIVEQNNNEITIKGPAKNFDKKGFFKAPKIITRYKIGDKKDYENSLFKSVSLFLNYVKKNKKFDINQLNKSLKSNEFLLK